jgi:nitrite reductase/ring-hydroxylating ferredoxin subunit
MAKATGDCCTVPGIPAEAVEIGNGLVTIDLDRTPSLERVGSFRKVVDESRKLNLIIVRPEKSRYVVLDQRCTHGGGALTYVHRHQHLYCTCWGHAKFGLDGKVIRWPNQREPKPLRAYAVKREGRRLVVTVEGLV